MTLFLPLACKDFETIRKFIEQIKIFFYEFKNKSAILYETKKTTIPNFKDGVYQWARRCLFFRWKFQPKRRIWGNISWMYQYYRFFSSMFSRSQFICLYVTVWVSIVHLYPVQTLLVNQNNCMVWRFTCIFLFVLYTVMSLTVSSRSFLWLICVCVWF